GGGGRGRRGAGSGGGAGTSPSGSDGLAEAERRGGPNGKRARVLAALCLGAGNSWRPDGLLLGRTSCCVELGLRVSGDDREPAQPSPEPRATRPSTNPWVAKIWREETMNGFMKKMVLV